MKRSFWWGLAAGLLAGSAQAQTPTAAPPSLAGAWQGAEGAIGDHALCLTVLRLQAGRGNQLFGVIYQQVQEQPGLTSTFQMRGTATAAGAQLEHVQLLNETGRTLFNYWCDGSITFTYTASEEKLTGHAVYRRVGHCDTGEYTLYRVRLKSAATVPAGVPGTLRVSGREVRWYADAALTQPVNAGNTYRTALSKTTTFYLTQDFYPSADKVVTPVTIQVSGVARVAAPPLAALAPIVAALPPAAAVPPLPVVLPLLAAAPAAAPVVLPTVLFKQGTATLLPEATPALNQLRADLQAAPALRLRIAGHTDRLGEAGKNQQLSEQRAQAIKDYLVRAGIAASRLETIGYGDTQPRYASPDVRNRRVEVERLP